MSPMRSLSCRLRGACAAALVVVGPSAGFVPEDAEAPPPPPVAIPRPLAASPLAPRGGVAMIPLEPPPPGQTLPRAADVRLSADSDAPLFRGAVAWLVETGPPLVRRWSESPTTLRIVTLRDGEDPGSLLDPTADPPRVAVRGAVLLVELPPTSSSPELLVGLGRVQPDWFDAAEPLGPFAGPAPEASDAEPDPAAPGEWFRHAIRADLGWGAAPRPSGGEVESLLARHAADLWRGGIRRVERVDPATAAELRDRLVAVAEEILDDGSSRRIAAWIAAETDLAVLLGLLHDRSRDDAAVARSVRSWLDLHPPLSAWISGDAGGEVELTLLHGGREPLPVRLGWSGVPGLDRDETLPPRRLVRRTVPRPDLPVARAESAEPLFLTVESGPFLRRLPVPPGPTPVRPPALRLGSLVAPRALHDIQAEEATPASSSFAAAAQVRKRGGRWEFFAECLRDGRVAADDRLELLWNGRALTVFPDGSVRGAGRERPTVSVAAGPGRWRVRIEVPDAWLPAPGASGTIVPIGLVRRAGAARAYGMLPREAFVDDPATVEIDLSGWDGPAPGARGLEEADGGRRPPGRTATRPYTPPP